MAGKRHCWYEAKESKLIYEKAKVSAWDFGDSLLLSVVKWSQWQTRYPGLLHRCTIRNDCLASLWNFFPLHLHVLPDNEAALNKALPNNSLGTAVCFTLQVQCWEFFQHCPSRKTRKNHGSSHWDQKHSVRENSRILPSLTSIHVNTNTDISYYPSLQ